MFFCEPCRKQLEWPSSIAKSYGQCEMCDTEAACNDVPSKYLATVKVKPPLDMDSIT